MLQNQILKEEATKLLDKNDNLNEVVSELSTYYVHIKKASEKTQELNEYLTNPDDTLEEKIKKSNNKTEEEKKFFQFYKQNIELCDMIVNTLKFDDQKSDIMPQHLNINNPINI